MSDLLRDPRPFLDSRTVAVRDFPARPGDLLPFPDELDPFLIERLVAAGMTGLYRHQDEAFRTANRDLMIATPTASGKTLAYALPVLQTLLKEPFGRAVFVYPTKALARDQLDRLRALAGDRLVIEAYDGDTSRTRRTAIRKTANILLTNPDLLHAGLLPGHETWGPFLRSCRFLVVDELHAYRGVFGSHVANVFRRFLRIAARYRSHPRIIAGSATIGNPRELFAALFGREATLIDRDSAPSGARRIVFARPPEIAPGRYSSPNAVVGELLAELVDSGVRTLAFSRARVTAELVLRLARFAAADRGLGANLFESYRAGYTVKERRAIENALFRGKLAGLSATDALELGIDVGGLDAVLMNGYPGSVNSFWQRAGRAGRGGRDGLAIMVAREDPLDAYLLRHPEAVLDAARERALVRPENPKILEDHLLCAVAEAPLSPSETSFLPDGALDAVERLERRGQVHFVAGAFRSTGEPAPALAVSIRGIGGPGVSLRVGDVEIGTMEQWRAMHSAHEGAVYLHRGATFVVESLDLEKGVAAMRPAEVDHYTQAVVQSVIVETGRRGGDGRMALVDATVSEEVIGFRRKALDGSEQSDVEPLLLPPIVFETTAVRLELPTDTGTDVDPARRMGGLHGAEHALLAIAPLFAGCDRGDLGSSWFAAAPPDGRPCVYVYDRAPGGVGLSDGLFADRAAWVEAAHRLVAECACADGCPVCLLSPRCESANEPLDKPETAAVLAWLTERLR